MDLGAITAISLATAAVSILATHAEVTERLRVWVQIEWGLKLNCPFCASWWVAVPVTAMAAPADWSAVLYYLSGVGGAALVASVVLRE